LDRRIDRSFAETKELTELHWLQQGISLVVRVHVLLEAKDHLEKKCCAQGMKAAF
jgi:hypothetical protein